MVRLLAWHLSRCEMMMVFGDIPSCYPSSSSKYQSCTFSGSILKNADFSWRFVAPKVTRQIQATQTDKSYQKPSIKRDQDATNSNASLVTSCYICEANRQMLVSKSCRIHMPVFSQLALERRLADPVFNGCHRPSASKLHPELQHIKDIQKQFSEICNWVRFVACNVKMQICHKYVWEKL